MINEFENFDSIVDWIAYGTAQITGLCPDQSLIAGNLANSFIFRFRANGDYCIKTFGTAIDVTNYSELVLHVWSQNNGKNRYDKHSDFLYQIELGSGKTYYLPCYDTFCDVTIDISNLSTIEYVRIIYLGDVADYLVLSYGVLVEQELPLDVFVGMKKEIDKYLLVNQDKFYAGDVLLAEAEDNFISFETVPLYLDRYAAFRIKDLSHEETHHVGDVNGNDFRFTSLYSGEKLANGYSSASVYIYIPCEHGKKEIEAVIPSISISGVSPVFEKIDSDLDNVLDTWKVNDTVAERGVGRFYRYDMMIDCESRSDEILMFMSRIVKLALSNFRIWVGGKAVTVTIDNAPMEVYPTEAINVVPKLQFTVSATIREEMKDRVYLPKTTLVVVDVEIQ